MASDLTDETGAVDPGVDRLFRTLTAPGTPGELAGEQDALAMFRANSVAAALPPVTQSAAPARSSAPPWRAALRVPTRWSVRLGAAVILALGGATAAAYAAVLPAPVQHLAHTVLGFAGVPDTQSGGAPSTSPRSGTHGGGAPGRSTHNPHPSSAPSVSSPGPTAPAAAGQPVLSAVAASGRIVAGSEAVIDGRLTRSGSGLAGANVTLLERLAGQAFWHVAGTGQTSADGNVAISVAALTTNAVFRLVTPGAPITGDVLVIVTPQIVTSLTAGPGGVLDALTVSTVYADAGNLVVLQVQTSAGWQYVRSQRLGAAGQTTFALSGRRLGNRVVRVVLLGTIRHGDAIASPVAVPPG